MAQTGKSKTCVWRWQERFMTAGVAGLLHDRSRPPGIAPTAPDKVAEIVRLTHQPPPHEAKPREDQIRMHRIPPRHLRHGDARRVCLTADRAFLLVRPEPPLVPLLARHGVPQDVHYRSWTLSADNPHRQSNHNGRIPSTLEKLPGHAPLYPPDTDLQAEIGVPTIVDFSFLPPPRHGQNERGMGIGRKY